MGWHATGRQTGKQLEVAGRQHLPVEVLGHEAPPGFTHCSPPVCIRMQTSYRCRQLLRTLRLYADSRPALLHQGLAFSAHTENDRPLHRHALEDFRRDDAEEGRFIPEHIPGWHR